MRLHLGVDYGTSASKLVLRHFEAPGGERAYLLERDSAFRIPSAVAFDAGSIHFFVPDGRHGAHRSVKMRFAGEVVGRLRDYFYGEALEIPYGLTTEDVVTLTVWKLISTGHLGAVRLLDATDFQMGMTLGVPMSFLDDPRLKAAYLRIARVAYRIYKDFGPIGADSVRVGIAKEMLAAARDTVDRLPDLDGQAYRNWVRSETEASMFWSFWSPSLPIGPYFCVDIGAGTTDSNAFMIVGEHDGEVWRKDSIAFFGAHSIPYAVDALRALTKAEIKAGLLNLRGGLVRSAQVAYSLIRDNLYSVQQWGDCRLIVLGGGSLLNGISEVLKPHPMNAFRGQLLERVNLAVPDDLYHINGRRAGNRDVVFTSVAYGLAQLAMAVPEAALPSEVQPVRPIGAAQRPGHEELYWD